MLENQRTVALYSSLKEARRARDRLAEAGIPAMLGHESRSDERNASPVTLFVADIDHEQAVDVLSALREEVLDPDIDLTVDGPDEEDEEGDSSTAAADALAHRAWKASLLGLLICFPLLEIYSIWLTFQLAFTSGELSPTGTRRLCGAVLINIVSMAVVYVVAMAIFGG